MPRPSASPPTYTPAHVKAMRAEARAQHERFCRLPRNVNGATTILRGGPLDGLPWRVAEGPHPVGSSYGVFINVDGCPMVQLIYRRDTDGHWHFIGEAGTGGIRSGEAHSV